MNLQTYISDMSRRRALAEALDTSPQYLWQLATGWKGRRPSPELAVDIERHTNGVVTCEAVRGDLLWMRDDAGCVTGYQVRIAAQEDAA